MKDMYVIWRESLENGVQLIINIGHKEEWSDILGTSVYVIDSTNSNVQTLSFLNILNNLFLL